MSTTGEIKEESRSNVPDSVQPDVSTAPSTASANEKGPSDLETAPEKPTGPPPPPDGGFKAWATVVGSWLVLFSTFGYINAFGVYQDYYLEHFLQDKNASDISWIGSFQVFCMFFFSIITGRLFDEGYFHYLMIFGSVLSVFALMMVSLAQDYYNIFLSQGVALGIGLGTLFLPSVGVISHHFAKRRALATGIVVSGSSCGGVVFPIMLNKLFDGSAGFGWAVRATAFLILGCLIAANLLMSTRLPPRKKRPAHMQVKPDIKGILTDGPYLIFMAGAFLVILGLFTPFFYIQTFARVHGVPENIAFYSLSILNGASVFGRTIPNFLADKLGSMNMLIPCVTLAAILQFPWLASGNVGGTVCIAIFYGFFSGAYVSLLPTSIAGFARGVPEIGMRLGFSFVAASFGALVGTPIVGALLGDDPADFKWWAASTFSAVVMLAGAALFVISRTLVVKRKGTQLV